MKPHLLKVPTLPVQSFSVRRDTLPNINNRWHYHPELELIHFQKGEGTQFVGDSINRFKDGDVVLIGSRLPHYWRFDEQYTSNPGAASDIRVAHFTDTFWGREFLNLPEAANVRGLFEKAKRGIAVLGKARISIAGVLKEMTEAEGMKRISLLLDALEILSKNGEYFLLSSIGFRADYAEEENERINKIYEFSLQNFKRKIDLKEVADVAAISPNSFCRYFKSRTRKTYSTFMLEIKVGHACKLLIEDKLPIQQIVTESGFHTISGFYRYFKTITGRSPLQYQKDFIKKT